MSIRKPAFAALLPLACAACATPDTDPYPSLAIRDVERVDGTFEPVESERLDVPPVETPGTGDLASRLATLEAQARAAHTAFLAIVPAAERRVAAASGSAVGADAWASAQVALADLDSQRSQAATTLADLDILYTASAVQAENVAAVMAVRNEVIALVGEEDAVLERLRARVR